MDNYNQSKNFSKSTMTNGEFLYMQDDRELHYTSLGLELKMKNSMTGERVYTESQVKTILHIYGLSDADIDELFEYVCFCQIPLCKEVAEYEGWIGNGLIRKVNVCEGHKHLLIGYNDEKS